MRLAGLLLALLIHGGSPVELSPVDNQGCETDADCAAGWWCDTTAQFCPLGQPGIPDPNVTSLLSPMTASRPVSRANTSTTTMNTPRPAPRMLDDHELPRPPIARNERGLGSTWPDA